MVYNVDPIEVLCDVFKGIDIKVYRETETDDANSIPASYIILRSTPNDSPSIYGDGHTLVRGADCDIILVSQGPASNPNCLHFKNKKKIVQRLNDNDISYNFYDLGYDENLKISQLTFAVRVNYGEKN